MKQPFTKGEKIFIAVCWLLYPILAEASIYYGLEVSTGLTWATMGPLEAAVHQTLRVVTFIIGVPVLFVFPLALVLGLLYGFVIVFVRRLLMHRGSSGGVTKGPA